MILRAPSAALWLAPASFLLGMVAGGLLGGKRFTARHGSGDVGQRGAHTLCQRGPSVAPGDRDGSTPILGREEEGGGNHEGRPVERFLVALANATAANPSDMANSAASAAARNVSAATDSASKTASSAR